MEDIELKVMQAISLELSSLENEATVKRVLQWAAGRYGVTLDTSSVGGKASTNARVEEGRFEGIADLFDAANPSTEPEKVLVVAFWFQEIQGQGDVDSQSLNTELKNLGHGIGNITRALDNLINRKPRLVIQTRKSGASQQARKRFKVTTEGIKAAKAMIDGDSN